MSEPQSVTGNQTAGRAAVEQVGVRAAIARASQATGMDFRYLLAQAKLESSLNPSARAPTSSAAGLYQFTQGTWLNTLERHGAELGMDWVNSVISGGKLTDPAARSQVMAMRYDPETSAMMAAELASDNRADLSGVLGRDPDSTELYLAHFLGSAGAKAFLSALGSDPGQSAAAVVPKAAAANRTIFYDGNGAPRSVGAVMAALRDKVTAAMDGASPAFADYAGDTQLAAGQPVQPQFTGGPIARQFAAARQDAAAALPARPSMADTLQTAFAVAGTDGQANVPAFVRAAYGQLQKFGL